ncbi:MAG: TonB family protein, partial [Rhodocyclales bacterium]|nr:TonB family protein [Rhodocyclales bacterium]
PPAAPRPQAPPDGAPHAAPAATAAPAPPLRDTTAAPAPPYFPSKALSRLPEALTEFVPILPDGAAAHVGGRLELRLWLDRDGRIDRVVLLRTQLPDAVDAAALAAFARMRFRPAEIQGVPVAAWLDTVVEFAAAEF